MKTMTYWTNAFAADRDATRAELHAAQNDREQLVAVFNETRDIGPKKTVEKLIDRIGYDRAAAAIATMINVIGEWDGRIDNRNREWAKTIDDAMDREAAQNYGLYCSLHSCHADQIADEMRRAERPIETVEDVEDEQTEETENDATEAITETAEAAEDETVEAEAEQTTEDATENEETSDAEQTETSKIDRDATSEYIDSLCDPDSLGVHDYIEEMKRDIAQYIMDEAEIEDGEDRDDFEQRINDDLWIQDSVTGNGSGSYTFSAAKAHENVMGNEDYIREMVHEWGIEAQDLVDRFLNAEWEWFDVSIRCYLLGPVLAEVIDDLIEAGAIRFAA